MADEATDKRPRRPRLTVQARSGLKLIAAIYRTGGEDNFVDPQDPHAGAARKDLDAAADWIERMTAWMDWTPNGGADGTEKSLP